MQRYTKSLLTLIFFSFIASCGGGGGGGGESSTTSSNANLSNLSISASALEQTFDPTLVNYTASVSDVTYVVTVTATAEDTNISGITINGVSTTSGATSAAINLGAGENDIAVEVTAENGSTMLTYSITVTRAARDSEWVVFLADKDTDDITELYAVEDDNGGSEPIKLSETLPANGKVLDFAISPDKTLIAYLAGQEAATKFELYVVPVDAADSGYKADSAYNVSGTIPNFSSDVKSFAWSPDSSSLVFLADIDTLGTDELYMVNSDGTNLHNINGPTAGVVEIGEFSWSDDSRYVAYKVYNLNTPAEFIGINSHDSQSPNPSDPGYSVRLNPSLVSGGSIKAFSWVPNSNLVVYLADQDVLGQNELFYATSSVSQVSTKLNHPLVFGASVTDYAWSPDGSNVAYFAETNSGNGLYTSQVSGLSGTSLSSLTEITHFSWSPDSQYLGYLASNPSQEFYYSTPDAAFSDIRLSDAMTANGNVRRFQWSPNSTAVAYLADQDSDEMFELYLSTLDNAITGQKLSANLTPDGDVQAFAWSPDSTLVAYRADAETEGLDALYTSHVDGYWTGNRISAETLPSGNNVGVFSFAWAGNSSALTYQASEITSGVVELSSNLADGGPDINVLSGTLVSRGDVDSEYNYDSGPQLPDTQQVKVTNLFENGSFSVNGFYGPELCGVVYEPVGDALLVTNCDHGGANLVLKYSFETQLVTTVYEYTSQHDYGLRLFDDELWIIRTYDKGLLRLTDLQNETLTLVDSYFGNVADDELAEIYDAALSEGNLYFVAGNHTGPDQYTGIRAIEGPAYSNISELVSGAVSMWPNPAFGYQRSMISVGTGANAYLIAATGPEGDIERWDLSGNLINSVADFGNLYLQKDSLDRVYAIDGSSVYRWQADLSGQETFDFSGTLTNSSRFVLRERDTEIEIIATSFRSETPTFNLVTVPN